MRTARTRMPKRVNGTMKHLVHDSAGEGFQVRALGVRDTGELAERPRDFLLRHRVRPAVELIDRRAQLALAVPDGELLDVPTHNCPRGLDRLLALGKRVGDDLLKVVEVVEVNVL